MYHSRCRISFQKEYVAFLSTRVNEKERETRQKKRKKRKKLRYTLCLLYPSRGKGGGKKTCSEKKSSCSRVFFVLLSIEHERKKRTHDPSHGYVGNTFFFSFFLLLFFFSLHTCTFTISTRLSRSRAAAPLSVPFSFRGGARSVYLEYGLLFLGTVLTFLPRVNVFVHDPPPPRCWYSQPVHVTVVGFLPLLRRRMINYCGRPLIPWVSVISPVRT